MTAPRVPFKPYTAYQPTGNMLYDSIAAPDPLTEALGQAVNGFLAMREQKRQAKAEQDEQEREFKKANLNANVNIAMANAMINGQQLDAEERDKQLAAKRQHDQIVSQLRNRFGSTQDPSVIPQLLDLGEKPDDIRVLERPAPKPAPGPDTTEEDAYHRTKGTLRAEKEAGAGAWKPKAAGAPGLSSVEAQRQALQAVQTHLNDVMTGEPRYRTPNALIAHVVNDPSFTDQITDDNFLKALRAKANAAVTDWQRKNAPKKGKMGLGAAAAMMAGSPPR